MKILLINILKNLNRKETFSQDACLILKGTYIEEKKLNK